MQDDSGKQRKGFFIVIDGIDGSGKTTQIDLLLPYLESLGKTVRLFDFPQYGTKSAGPAEEYLSGKYGKQGPKLSSLLYAVDRFDASFAIREALEQGHIVVCNRYVTANAGHQGGKIADKTERAAFYQWLEDLEYGICNIPKPDVNIILHVDYRVAYELTGKKYIEGRSTLNGTERDLHEKDLEHLRNAEAIYLEIAELFPNTRLIECMQEDKLIPIEAVHEKIKKVIQELS